MSRCSRKKKIPWKRSNQIANVTCYLDGYGKGLKLIPDFCMKINLDTCRQLYKRIVNFPEESVPVISSTNWLGWFYKNPKQDVSRKLNHVFLILIHPSQIKDYLLSLFPILTWITRYSQLIYGELEFELR